MIKCISIDDHVNSIIANNGPVLARKYVHRAELDIILKCLERRIDAGLAPASLRELRPYDFHGTRSLWEENGEKDYELARELTHRAVQTIMQQKGWDFIKFVQNVTQKIFVRTPINSHGTKAWGMVGGVYTDIYQDAVIDMVQHDKRYSEWKDLQKYDFKKMSRLTDQECRELTHTLLQKIMNDNGWNFVQLIRGMRNPPPKYTGWGDAFKLPFNRYGTTLAGVIDKHRDSPAETILDLVIHDERYRKYRDLRLYDFPDQRNIWVSRDGKKNYALAREATGVLMAKFGVADLTLPEILKRATDPKFRTTKINRYGTILWGMVQRTYRACVRLAIQDWFMYGRKNDALI
jgi:hypothetical protein